MIVLNNMQFSWKETLILNIEHLHIKANEKVFIQGVSGSGKSTLLNLMAGVITPQRGEIIINGSHLNTINEEQRSQVRADHVGFIFQQFLLISSLTALENVMLPAELANDPKAKQLALDLLAQVGLSVRANHFPAQLSGGEQQRVAIARAFITKPDVLFADEPTGNLDKTTSTYIADLLFDLNKQFGTTLVLVTHDLTLAQRCQRRVEMQGGRLINDQYLNDIKTEKSTIDTKAIQAGIA